MTIMKLDVVFKNCLKFHQPLQNLPISLAKILAKSPPILLPTVVGVLADKRSESSVIVTSSYRFFIVVKIESRVIT